MFRSIKSLVALAIVAGLVMLAVPASCQLTNGFNRAITSADGPVATWDGGWLGYTVWGNVWTQPLVVTALGRNVVNGTMNNSHQIVVWQDGVTSAPIATVTVTAGSPTDTLGYKYEMLPTPITLPTGGIYHILVREQGGDPYINGVNLRGTAGLCQPWQNVRGYAIDTTADISYPNILDYGWQGSGYGVPTWYTGTGAQNQPISGYVENASGVRLAGATVTAVKGTDTPLTTTTAGDGTYSMVAAAGTYSVTASKAGYASQTDSNVVVGSSPVTKNFTLELGSAFVGYVEDGSSNRIAGATVVATGTASPITVTTASDGTYTILAYPGTFSITASKFGFDAVTVNNVVLGGTPVTENFTLPLGKLISGTVTDSFAPNPPIVGASVLVSNGVDSASTTTDSAGSYGIRVAAGSYSMIVRKADYVAAKVFNIDASGNVTQNVTMVPGWDLAGDFVASATSPNPNGPWTYGYDSTTSSTFKVMIPGAASPGCARQNVPYAGAEYHMKEASTAGWFATWFHNGNLVTMPKSSSIRGVAEPWAVLTHPGFEFGYGDQGIRTITRFIAPKTGYFDVDVKWTGRTDNDGGFTWPAPATLPSVNGTTSNVEYRKNGTTVYTGQLNGYVGTPPSYSDKFGTAPEQTYHSVGLVNAGDVLDVIVSGDNSGWTGVDFTVSARSAAFITGTVRSDKTGNPVIREATVRASAGEDLYEVTTDADGKYVLMVPGTTEAYTITVMKPNHNNGGASATVAAGETAVRDFTLHFNNQWDATADFSSLYNPNGEWSYGWSTLSSNHAQFSLYTQMTGVIGSDYLNYKFWTTDGGHMWAGGVRKNPNAVMDIWQDMYGSYRQTWYSEANQLVMFPGGQPSGQNYDFLSVVRWTAPRTMVADVDTTWSSQWGPGFMSPDGGVSSKYPLLPAVVKNGSVIATPSIAGFAGRAVNGYTDSFAEAGLGLGPKETFKTAIAVNAGDTLDFTFQGNNLGPYLIGLDLKVKEYSGAYAFATSIAQIKQQADGTMVFMTTPVQLGCGTRHNGTGLPGSFGYRYGNPSVAEKYFYVQTDDRLQGLKLVAVGGLADISVGHKVTFTGTVATDATGQKYVQVGSIDSSITSADPKPFGKVGKTLTNTGVLTRVWGKIVSRTDNPVAGTPFKDFAYLYITINDGSQDVKVLMNVQGEFFSDYDAWVRDLNVGDYIGVTGITSTTTGTDAVIMPRCSADILNYTDMSM